MGLNDSIAKLFIEGPKFGYLTFMDSIED